MKKVFVTGCCILVVVSILLVTAVWLTAQESVRNDAVAAGAAAWVHSPNSKEAVFTWNRPPFTGSWNDDAPTRKETQP